MKEFSPLEAMVFPLDKGGKALLIVLPILQMNSFALALETFSIIK